MAWYNSSWLRRKKFRLPAASVPASCTDIPLLIAGTISDFTNAQSAGLDFVVTNSDGTTKIPRELLEYNNSTGQIAMWFKATVSSATDNDFYVYYDNQGSSDQNEKNSVWTNGFEAVYHLTEDPTAASPQYKDSTSNNRHCAKEGAPARVAGRYTLACELGDANESAISTASFTIGGTGDITIEVYVQPIADTGPDMLRVCAGTATLQHTATDFQGTISTTGGSEIAQETPKPPLSQWHYFAARWDEVEGAMRMYSMRNGTWGGNVASSFGSGNFTNTSGLLQIGGVAGNGDSQAGIYQEARVSNLPRTAAWLEITAKTMHNYASFWTVSAEELFADQPAVATISGVRSGSMVSIVQSPRKEVTQVTTPANTASSLNGKYFDFTTPTTLYRPWYSTLGVGTPPSSGGRTLINIDLSASTLTAVQVAAESKVVIDALPDVEAVIGGARESTSFTLPADTAGNKAGTYWRANSPDGVGGEIPFVIWYQVDGTGIDPRGLREITLITCVADVSGSLGGKYFTFTAQDSTDVNYYVWYNGGGDTDPAPGGTGIQVNYTDNDSAVLIATKTASALQGFTRFSSSRKNDNVVIVNTNIGAVTNAADGTAGGATGFTFTISQNGADPAVAGLEPMRGIRVSLAGNDNGLTNATKTSIAVNAVAEFTCIVNPLDLDEIIITNVAGGDVTAAADGGGGKAHGITALAVDTTGTSDAVEITNVMGGQVTNASAGTSGATITVLVDGDDIRNVLAKEPSATRETVELIYLVGDPFDLELVVEHDDYLPISIETIATQVGVSFDIDPFYRPDRVFDNP